MSIFLIFFHRLSALIRKHEAFKRGEFSENNFYGNVSEVNTLDGGLHTKEKENFKHILQAVIGKVFNFDFPRSAEKSIDCT
jgi:hypothetical protein